MSYSFIALLALSTLFNPVYSHYIFERLTYNGVENGVYQYIRENTNYNSPVTDLTSNDLRCNVGATGAGTDTISIVAGSTVSFTADIAVYHDGPTSFYMAKAPTTAAAYDGSGQNWFKIKDIGPTFDASGNAAWDLEQTYSVTLPSQLPNGDYLLRIQQLGIHNPWPAGIPQFYISCAQITITGGGTGNPNPLVSIPGFITGTEPGYTVNIYNNFHNYTVPGPAVWDPNSTGGASPPPPPPPPVSSTHGSTFVTSTTARTTSSPNSTPTPTQTSGAGAPLYGQCGGQGWTGPTTCAQGVCKVSNAYYSQCLPS